MTASRTLWKDLGCISCLIACGGLFLWSILPRVDLALYDETFYLAAGVSLPSKGLPEASWGPLYAFWYHILSVFEPGKIDLFYLNFSIICMLMPFLLFILLRRMAVARGLALSASLWMLVCYQNISVWPKVWHFALLLILTGLLACTFLKSTEGIFLVGALAALAASYARPELSLSFALIAAAYLWTLFGKSSGTSWPGRVVFPCLLGGASLYFIHAFGMPVLSGETRLFYAFQQYFSANWVEWSHSGLDPMTDCREIILGNFGNVSGIGGALLNNPAAFLRHAFRNLVWAPIHAGSSFFLFSMFAPNKTPKTIMITQMLVTVSLAIFMIMHRTRVAMERGPRLVERDKAILLLLGLFCIPSLISTIVIFPQFHYLLGPGTLGFIALMIGFGRRPDLRKDWVLGAAMAGTAALCLVLFPVWAGNANRPVWNAVRMIDSLAISRRVTLLDGGGGHTIYLPSNYRRIPYDKKEGGFEDFMKRRKINMIVSSQKLMSDKRYAGDREWMDFIDGGYQRRFVKLRVPGSDSPVFVARELMKGAGRLDG